jgi:hypothetical protein
MLNRSIVDLIVIFSVITIGIFVIYTAEIIHPNGETTRIETPSAETLKRGDE